MYAVYIIDWPHKVEKGLALCGRTGGVWEMQSLTWQDVDVSVLLLILFLGGSVT